ncbi:hypothetical protein L195_g063025, partial [Trifolium pratense]
LVFGVQSFVNTSEKTSETIEGEPQNPKSVSEVVETKAPISDNPNLTENLGSAAEKEDNTTSEPVESDMQTDDIPIESVSKNADKSPT